jgi:hypothetical protein
MILDAGCHDRMVLCLTPRCSALIYVNELHPDGLCHTCHAEALLVAAVLVEPNAWDRPRKVVTPRKPKSDQGTSLF